MTAADTPYEFLARFDAAGALAGMHYQTRTIYRDESGHQLFERLHDPQPVAVGADVLATVLPELNLAALARVQELEGRLAVLEQTLAEARGAGVQREMADLTSQPATTPAPGCELLLALNAAFAGAVPEPMRSAFAAPYALVRVLVQAGQPQMARDIIEGVQVPEHLMDAKARLLAVFSRVELPG